MFSIGPSELILILAVALIIFGPGRLPEIGRMMGRAMSEMQKATREIQQTINLEAEDTPGPQQKTSTNEPTDRSDPEPEPEPEQSDSAPQSEQGR